MGRALDPRVARAASDPAAPPGITPPSVPFGHDARAAAVRRVAAIMLEHLDGLSVRSATEIWNREPEFRDCLEAADELYDHCRATIGGSLRMLVAGDLDDDRLAGLRELGRSASDRGIPLEVLHRGLRIDFLVLWSEMLLVARTTDPSTQQGVINASEIVWGAVDAVTVQFTAGYRSNHEARSRAEAVRRDTLLRQLLRGEPVPAIDVSSTLGIHPEDDVIVIAADPAATPRLGDLARALRFAGLHSTWVETGDEATGLVALRGARPVEASAALRGVAGVRAGLSRLRRGTSDIAAAAREARLALSTMRAGADGIVDIFDDPLSVLLASQPDLSATLLQHVLGPVLDRPPRERQMLLDTIVAFDDCEGSVGAVAGRLFCHRNTVLNRLGKIGRLTGISFAAPSGLAMLALVARSIRTGLLDRTDPGRQGTR